jgi:nitrate reductase delta subunit
MAEAGVDLEGELPDHLVPILRYLGTVENPLPELTIVIGPAVQRMLSVLRGALPGNPYGYLLEAVLVLCKGFVKEEA